MWYSVSQYQCSNQDIGVIEDIRRLLPDIETEFGNLRLTKIHKILLEMEAGDLDEELGRCAGTGLIDEPDNGGKTPLIWAAFRGNENAVKSLLEHGADTTKRDKRGECALSSASTIACFELCLKSRSTIENPKYIQYASKLLEYGADINLGSRYQSSSPLQYVASPPGGTKEIKWLLDSGADVNWIDDMGETVIMEVIRADNRVGLSIILSEPRGIDFALTNIHGMNILHFFARWASYETLELFRNVDITGVDADREDNTNNTPLQHAINRFEWFLPDLVPESRRKDWWELFTLMLDKARGTPRVLQLADEIAENDAGLELIQPYNAEYGSDDDEFHDAEQTSN
ncbi:hypothetical protein TWF281_009716 [Arthrobotrys megalospora]